MAASQLIAIGTDVASSDDIEVTDTQVTVGLKVDPATANDRCQIDICLKNDEGNYDVIGTLSNYNQRALVLSGPGTYRLSRTADSAACGAYSA